MWRRSRSATASTLGLTLALTAFGWSQAGVSNAATCDAYAGYGTFDGASVSINTSMQNLEAENYEKAFAEFEGCTGIDIVWEGTENFESLLRERVAAGNAPDLAMVSQPGLVASFAASGDAKPASAAVAAQAAANYSQDWVRYGTVDGVFYAPPAQANVKSFVWYSPSMFADNDWEVPQTWAELKALSADIAATGVTPWCAGVESGGATGWTATDWVEDVLLRTAGAEVYDQWVSHEIPFNDPEVVAAVDEVGSILKNPEFVNGGIGDVASVATTPFQEAGLPILQGTCAMHRQASFYATMWPEGTKVAADGDIYAFYLPSVNAGSRPVVGGGELLTAFNEEPATQAVQLYLTSAEFVNAKAALGGWLTPNNKLDPANVVNPIDKLSTQLLQDPKTVFRFDGSDLMPAAVGAGTFWTEMVEWLQGQSTADTLTAIEASWPES
jgi:alpha-glucoside transport system substrate-binding protein